MPRPRKYMNQTEAACKGCGETKPLEDFKVDRTRPSGHKQPCKSCNNANSAKWEKENVERKRARQRHYAPVRRQRLRAELLEAYGDACNCCGESTPDFLTIDHIANDGAKHRREIGIKSGNNFYRWLKRNGFPKDRFQLLCFNCNCAKGFYGECPHMRAKPQAA